MVRKVTYASYERLLNQIIHWTVVLIICTFVFILRLRSAIDTASVTALFGTVLGHLGLASIHRSGDRRSTDDGDNVR